MYQTPDKINYNVLILRIALAATTGALGTVKVGGNFREAVLAGALSGALSAESYLRIPSPPHDDSPRPPDPPPTTPAP